MNDIEFYLLSVLKIIHFCVILPFSSLALFYFLDVLQSGILREANSLADPSLRTCTSPSQVRVQGSFCRADMQIWLDQLAWIGSF